MGHCKESYIPDRLFPVNSDYPFLVDGYACAVYVWGRRSDHIAGKSALIFLFFRFSAAFHLSDVLIYHAEVLAVLGAGIPLAGAFPQILVDVVFLGRITGRRNNVLMGSLSEPNSMDGHTSSSRASS